MLFESSEMGVAAMEMDVGHRGEKHTSTKCCYGLGTFEIFETFKIYESLRSAEYVKHLKYLRHLKYLGHLNGS